MTKDYDEEYYAHKAKNNYFNYCRLIREAEKQIENLKRCQESVRAEWESLDPHYRHFIPPEGWGE